MDGNRGNRRRFDAKYHRSPANRHRHYGLDQ